MLPNNILEICKNLGLEKQDIEGALADGEQKGSPKNDKNNSSELYKAGSRYGTTSINDF